MNGIEAGKAYVKFLLDDKDLTKSLAKVGAKLQSVGKIGLAATTPIIGAFTAATVAALEYGDGIGDMAARTGIAAKELSALQYAADQSDVSIQALERGVQKMTLNIGNAANGTGTFGKTLEQLGIGLTELRGLNPDQQFAKLADAIKKIEDPALRAALAQKTFGKASLELMPLLMQGSKGISGLAAEAEALGIVLTEKDVEALGELDQALKTSKQQLFGMAVQVGAAVAGPLTDFLTTIQPIVASVVEWIRNNPELTRSIAAVTAAIAAASAASYALGTVFTFLSLHPFVRTVIVLTAAVVALNEALKNLSDWAADSPELQEMKKELEENRKVLAEADRVLGNEPAAPTGISGLPTPASLQAEALQFQARMDSQVGGAVSQLQQPPVFDPQTASDISQSAGYLQELVAVAKSQYEWFRGNDGGFIAGTE